MKVLMVCTGNICRSPMAEALLRHELVARGRDDVDVASAGTWAFEGNPATREAGQAIATRGVDVSDHRSHALDPEDLRTADLVVAMTSVHVREICEVDPDAAGKTVLIKQLASLKDRAGTEGSWVDRLLQAERLEWLREHDLDDPIGLPLFAYERCLEHIEKGVAALADLICSEEREKE